jgi:nicotinamide-nucleotide amidase
MITLYHIAQLTSGIVISTDNYSEYWMGFWTINGDVGDLAPIQQIFKGKELYDIAKALNVPKSSLNVAPTDGLDVIPGGTDQDQLKLPYEQLDDVIISLLKYKFHIKHGPKIISKISEKLKLKQETVSHIANQLKTTEYKRRIPIQFSRTLIGLPVIDKLK